jgi:myo-inositol-1(or 4)-monophosphatase
MGRYNHPKKEPSFIMPEFLQICEQAARAGGRVLLDWMGRFAVREKGPADLVTQADVASQQAIREVLLSHFPDHGFLAEENANEQGVDGRFRWIVDPLDGTVNYVHGVPQFAVSVALEQEGRVVCGTIFDPIAQECFCTARGHGAFLNGRRITTSRVVDVADALVVCSFPPRVKRDAPEVAQFIEVLVACQSMRRTGSAAINLAYLAAGRFDGYWAANNHAWDVAAGFLLVEEAGGFVTNFAGGPVDLDRPQCVTAGTLELHGQLRELVWKATRHQAQGSS